MSSSVVRVANEADSSGFQVNGWLAKDHPGLSLSEVPEFDSDRLAFSHAPSGEPFDGFDIDIILCDGLRVFEHCYQSEDDSPFSKKELYESWKGSLEDW